MLIGEFEVNSDDKGRISFPAKFKEELEGKKLVITKGISENCLTVYTMETFNKMLDFLYSSSNYTLLNKGISALQRVLIAPSVEFEMDKAQRFLIPQSLRAHAQIAPKSILIVLGLMDRLEIWEKQEYEKYITDTRPEVEARAQELFNRLEAKEEG